MTVITILPYGDRALLVEFESSSGVTPFRNIVVEQAHYAVQSVVPAARTVLVEFNPRQISRTAMVEFLEGCNQLSASASAVTVAEVQLKVRYDGADLAAVAAESRMSVNEVIQRHTGAEYVVQFCGFAPGFSYLIGLDPALRLARLTTPRQEVPAGSVAIADEFTAVYPRSSPGGWRLLGCTDTVLFDLACSPPALLIPGTKVRFIQS